MKKLLLFAISISAYFQAHAQAYSTVAVTGFNSDVVANGPGSATNSTTQAVDAVNFSLMSSDFVNPSSQAPTTFLPANGVLNSVTTSGLSFQLMSYTGNNDLRLTGTSVGTLTFTTPRTAQEIYLLGFSGSGANNATVTVTFTDNTTQIFTGLTFNDWFHQPGFAAQGFGRVNRVNNTIENSTINPRMYQIALPLSAANQNKQIQSILVAKSSGTGVINVMAVSVKNNVTGINELLPETALSVFPNPSSGTFTIQTELKNYTLEVTDLTGKIIQKHTVSNPDFMLQMGNTAKGIYLLKLVSEGKMAVRKLVVE